MGQVPVTEDTVGKSFLGSRSGKDSWRGGCTLEPQNRSPEGQLQSLWPSVLPDHQPGSPGLGRTSQGASGRDPCPVQMDQRQLHPQQAKTMGSVVGQLPSVKFSRDLVTLNRAVKGAPLTQQDVHLLMKGHWKGH